MPLPASIHVCAQSREARSRGQKSNGANGTVNDFAGDNVDQDARNEGVQIAADQTTMPPHDVNDTNGKKLAKL